MPSIKLTFSDISIEVTDDSKTLDEVNAIVSEDLAYLVQERIKFAEVMANIEHEDDEGIGDITPSSNPPAEPGSLGGEPERLDLQELRGYV